jgi:hypothetical protein
MNLDLKPITFQKWNPEFPLKSFQVFADYIHESTKQFVVTQKIDPNMLLFIPQAGGGHMATIRGASVDGDALAQSIRDYINQNYTYGFIRISVAQTWFEEYPIFPSMNHVVGQESKSPRIDPLTPSELLSVASQTRCGHSLTWLDQIIRDKGTDQVSIGCCQRAYKCQGLLGKLFG